MFDGKSLGLFGLRRPHIFFPNMKIIFAIENKQIKCQRGVKLFGITIYEKREKIALICAAW